MSIHLRLPSLVHGTPGIVAGIGFFALDFKMKNDIISHNQIMKRGFEQSTFFIDRF